MGLGAYHGRDDNDRRREIAHWFFLDERYPEDVIVVEVGRQLIDERLQGSRGTEVYEFPGVGRVVYLHALMGLMGRTIRQSLRLPNWLEIPQSELADWLRGAPKRKSQYFLDMANLVSYDLLPHARDDPRGQFAGERPAAIDH
jgi:hypothetical protein